MKHLFLFLFTLFFLQSNQTYAQSDLSKREVERLIKIRKSIGGTFQVQVINSRIKPTIPLSVFGEIENKRSETEVTYIYLSKHIRVKILPFSVIDDPNFKALDYISYIKL